jgi:hypothetical protein
MAARNSQTWIQASLDQPGPSFNFGMCGCDRWPWHYSTLNSNLWERRAMFGLTVMPAAEAKCTLLETQRLATNHATNLVSDNKRNT